MEGKIKICKKKEFLKHRVTKEGKMEEDVFWHDPTLSIESWNACQSYESNFCYFIKLLDDVKPRLSFKFSKKRSLFPGALWGQCLNTFSQHIFTIILKELFYFLANINKRRLFRKAHCIDSTISYNCVFLYIYLTFLTLFLKTQNHQKRFKKIHFSKAKIDLL